MGRSSLDAPLTDREWDRLAAVLDGIHNPEAMNIERLDGFFAALHCAPDNVPPSEYLPIIWDGELSGEAAFADREEAQEIFGLLMRHWNAIGHVLQTQEVYLPLLLMDETGIAHGIDWAKGFLRGMRVRPHSWQELLDDEERGGGLVLILMLAHEEDPDPRSWPAPIKPERRQEALAHLAAEVMLIYRYFAPARRAYAKALHEQYTQRRDIPKIGRNEPCPCGSGKKYKACCGRSHTLH